MVSSPDAAGKGGDESPSDGPGPGRQFPRSSRLTSRKQFLEVYDKGRRVSSSSFVLFGLENGSGGCRLGITVTRRVGNAVRRNRIKRMVREIFRHHRDELRPNLDLVVNVRESILGEDSRALEKEFLRTFGRLARRMAS